MALIGAILLIVGLIMAIKILWIIGLVLLAIGLLANFGPGPYRRRIY